MLPAMRHATLEVIRDEHQALAAMLRSMVLLLTHAHHEGRPPPFDVLPLVAEVDELPLLAAPPAPPPPPFWATEPPLPPAATHSASPPARAPHA